MRENQLTLLNEGRNKYGTAISNDRPPTPEELMTYHAKHHTGPFLACPVCGEIAAGEREMTNATNYYAECGHCGTQTEHDFKTRRCLTCGAKNDQVENDEGQSKLLHEWVDGKCKTCGITKTENCGKMCNMTELAAFPAPGMKNSILNSVGEGRRRYGNRTR